MSNLFFVRSPKISSIFTQAPFRSGNDSRGATLQEAVPGATGTMVKATTGVGVVRKTDAEQITDGRINMSNTNELLQELVRIGGVKTAVVVGRDGFVIDGVSSGSHLDTETVGAVISAGIGSSEVMGRELKVGIMSQGMMEYSGGLIMMSLVGNDAILAVVADTHANLGYVRLQIKKRLPAIEQAVR